MVQTRERDVAGQSSRKLLLDNVEHKIKFMQGCPALPPLGKCKSAPGGLVVNM